MSSEITLKQYWDEIKSIADEIADETKEQGEDQDWAFERLWETIDAHEWITYYWSQLYVLIFTDNDDAYFEMTGEKSVPGESLGEITQPLAFYAMHQDASYYLSEALDERDIPR